MRILLAAALLVAGCGEVWNDPYAAADRGRNVLYTSFTERPKHLDPASTITEDEARFTRQVYEPPVQYHYLKRPYVLAPLTATEVPVAQEAADGTVTYEVRLRPGVRFQPHPAFHAPNRQLGRHEVAALRTPYELPVHADRELEADDYIYQIKRLAHPRLNSPVYGLMADNIVGLRELGESLRQAAKAPGWMDLRPHPLAGVERIDAHAFRIRLKGRYPQFVYWLAMPYFAPMPWEAEAFFAQAGMAEKNFNLNWWPIGTGPFMLVENDPNARMSLVRNPNFRGEPYPSEGAPEDRESGLLADAGKAMPFLDEIRFVREREAIPFWNKFLQGYYDQSGIPADTFDNAVRMTIEGDSSLTPEMEAKGIRLRTSVATSVFYLGFNMQDPVVGMPKGGGDAADRARKLRQAISVAVDWEEYISIFLSGRGIAAQGPIPPGIFGWEEGPASINPVTHEWRDGRAVRRPVEKARALLAEAGYPDGRDAKTGAPLVLYLDTVARGPGDKPRFDWWRKQFAKLSIQLEVRDTDWNRLQDKIRKGSQQLYILGWNGDYPDPENFLFLLHGAQARMGGDGVNSSNYASPAYDALFPRMKDLPNGAERAEAIRRMVQVAREDAPWVFGYYPKDYGLSHGWLANAKPNDMAGNTMKYLRVDAPRREALRREWNRPVLWPGLSLLALLLASAATALAGWRRREARVARVSRGAA